MARGTAKGFFTPKNPQKIIKWRGEIEYRSGWELQLMNYFDQHPSVLGWASEPYDISYKNPLTGKWTFYRPDFIVVFVDKNGNRRAEMIEVKPAKESPIHEGKADRRARLAQAINAAKWQAAAQWCAKHNVFFRVMTEREMFGYK